MFKTPAPQLPSLFARPAPEIDPTSLSSKLPQRREIMELVSAASAAGGPFAAFKLGRAARGENTELIAETLRAYFSTQREMLVFRSQLALDNAKKRAIADNIGSTAQIEQEISRMTSDVIVALAGQVGDTREAAAYEEVVRMERLAEALKAKRITQRRYEIEVAAIEARADDIGTKAHAVAERVIENIGERLAAALRQYGVGTG
jgi:hypothetical protein